MSVWYPHHLVVVHRAGKQSQVLREAIHRIDGLARNAVLIIRRVAADQLGDEGGLRGREVPLGDGGGARRIFLERLMRGSDRLHCGERELRSLADRLVGAGERREGVALYLRRAVPPRIQYYDADTLAQRELGCHAVRPEA